MQRGGYGDTGGLNSSLKTAYITYLKDLAALIKAFCKKFTKSVENVRNCFKSIYVFYGIFGGVQQDQCTDL